ncbi:tyrosine decarboxylase 1-like [Pyrus ussuriensis x Pyrus communis]|uniref:Tyrosine decarboxylase 1-like n=1 Tax=Pyrus ussuriensis x Pyrus communis TaxID=2448454 RepID=A0A5N5FEI2_9ROSA|nr:tyrosine decarboxylase 1-like [Pyrus ussuriensis x Pyrus communis]
MGSLNIDNPPENNSAHHMTKNPLELVEFRRQGHMMIDFIADHYQNIQKHPVLSQVQPGYLRKQAILQDVQDHIVPGITHWQNPNHLAYFPATISTAGFLGEMLTTGFNVVGFNWMASPTATELETIVMDWLGDILKLPKSFLFSDNGGGVLHGSTHESVVCTMVAARDQILSQIGKENIGNALQKVSQIDGIHSKNFRAIETTRSSSFALSPELLQLAICSDVKSGLVPFYVCATVGTTTTTAVDPLGPLCDVAKDYGMWVHVDAAYAGNACICPEFRHFIDGIEGANSFSLSAHKWFFTTLNCCSLWVKNPSALTNSMSVNLEGLRNKATDSKQVVDYKDWQIALTQGFPAMKLWLVLRSYGVENLRNFIRSDVKMAKRFEGLVGMEKRFEVVVPRNFSLVCFRVLPSAIINKAPTPSDENRVINEVNCGLLEAINGSGLLRCAIGATLTEEKHVVMAWKVVKEHADAIFSMYC